MRLYTVHIRRNSEAPDHQAILVREGFSWGAFLFTVLWALWRRMWLGAFLILLGALLIDSLAQLANLDELSETVLFFAYALYIGFAGNDWRRRNLARRGFDEVAVVGARGIDDAERRYFDHMTGATVVAL
jgi:NhaP-type Na+/H+ or K+/H+ antiporter